MKILIIAAHPDDEVLGCGGTIARHAKNGHDVTVSILGEGVASRFIDGAEADFQIKNKLHTVCDKVVRFLGANPFSEYSFPDNRFDTIPLLDIVKFTERIIKKIQPEIIYTHHAGDLNIDHAIVHRAVLTATRPQKDNIVKKIFAFEVPSSTEWAFNQFEQFCPNTFVDIAKTIDEKIQAMSLYESEIRSFPHPRSPKALKAIAEKWGSTVGFQFAEAFQLIRSVR